MLIQSFFMVSLIFLSTVSKMTNSSICNAFCRGADIECVDKDNYTPLLLAASEGHTHVVQLLLEKGADLKKKDTQDKTAIFVAAEENCVDTLKVCSLTHLNFLCPLCQLS